MADASRLSDAERENLTRIILWHADAHAAQSLGGYASTGAQNVIAAVERILADRLAAAKAEGLREAIAQVQSIYDLQCPPQPERYVDRGAFAAHAWWSNVLGGTLDRLRRRADLLNGGDC